MKYIFVVALSLMFSCDGDSHRQVKVLKSLGMTKIHIEGYPLFGCGGDDFLPSSREFSAVSAANQSVSGVVCCGLIKGCTVRF